MAKKNPKVEFYFDKTGKWQNAVAKLRTLCLGSSLSEDVKWGCPCYTLDGSNIVLIHDFKEYCALLFFKGALMKDPGNLLVQQTKNVQSARQMRFRDAKEIAKLATQIKAYLQAAIAVERSGAKVARKGTEAFAMPEEFRLRLQREPALKEAFEKLTPGRQRGYLLFFSSAKQSATREVRVEKMVPRILDGLGRDD